MSRIAFASVAFCLAGSFAFAQTPQLGDSAKALLGSWEFSNADRDKICTVTFKDTPAPGGFKLEFDKNCVNLFPFTADIIAWNFPDNDLLHLVNAQGKALVEFSEVENGIYEAPTPGVGVLFLQNAADAGGPPARKPEDVVGDWAIVRGAGSPVCALALSRTATDTLAVTVKPGCDPAIARLNFQTWQLDRGELLLRPARGNPWRFEEVDNVTWRRLPETADQMTLVRQ
ncbi:MAG TPA: AprI/Inh family metalloprotease inhibitor [Pseudolabrys sp.]|nr:AprI/Inh family metalloprotease inhibitor [Pseudolabrys sp.]